MITVNLLALPGLEPFLGPEKDDPPATRTRPIAPGCTPDTLATWARATTAELGAAGHPAALDRVARLAYALTEDALEHGIAPMALEILVSATTVDVAACGARSVAHRTASQDAPRLAAARPLADHWTIRTGPGGRGSTLTASVSLTRGARLRSLLRALSGRRR